MGVRFVRSGFVVLALVLSGCQSGEDDQLRGQLNEAREQLAAMREEAGDSERARASAIRQLEQSREQLEELTLPERPGQGVVVSVPLLGTLTWDCNDARKFSFTYVPEAATVTVSHSVEGEVTSRRLHPGDEFAGPYLGPELHQEWTINYRHKPGTISAGISVTPDVHQGACLIRNLTLERNQSR